MTIKVISDSAGVLFWKEEWEEANGAGLQVLK